MKQRFVVTHRYTILKETEQTGQIVNMPTIKHVRFLRKYNQLFMWLHDFLLVLHLGRSIAWR